MALITTTNLNLKIQAGTLNTSTTLSGVAVPQKFYVGRRHASYGNTTTTDGYVQINNTPSVGTVRSGYGTSSEQTVYTLSGKIPYNKNVAIGLVALTPSAGYSVAKTPHIKLVSGNNSGLRVWLKKTSTSNRFNLMCNSSREISQIDDVVLSMGFLVSKTPTTSTNTIKSFYTGRDIVNKNGEKREIKIYGSPNTPFELSILNSDNESIISSSNSTSILPVGMRRIISSTLNKKGYYSHFQRFPRLPLIKSTKVNGSMAVSGATKVIFDSLTNVQVGDQLFLYDSNNKPFASGEPIKVLVLNPDTDNVNECTLSKSIIAADNTPVRFKRSTTYTINLETSGTKDSGITATYPTTTLNQYTDSVVKIVGAAVTGAAINGGSSGAAYNE
jgi:hypothetical protein